MTKRLYYNTPPRGWPPEGAPKDAVKAEFARRLDRLRLDRGWSQTQLAEEAQKHLPRGGRFQRFGRDSVHHYIRGRHLPGPAHLQALARALEVEPTDLLPAKSVPSVDTHVPSFEMKDVGEGMAWLRVNQAVPFNTALRIAQLLRESDEQVSN